MKDISDWQLNEQIDAVFREKVMPAFADLIALYNNVGGYVVKTVPDSPLITGISRYASVMVQHPAGVEMIVCVYWVEGSSRIVAENIRMVTLSKTFDIYTVTKEELLGQIKFLGGLVS